MNFWFVSDGKVMPSWLEIHEISIDVVSSALNLSIFSFYVIGLFLCVDSSKVGNRSTVA